MQKTALRSVLLFPKSIVHCFLTYPIVKFVLYSRRSGLKVLHSCPTLTLVVSATQRLCPSRRRERLGNEYAAFRPFSTGIEYEFYDSCVKKCYIALGNKVGCANLRVCRHDNSRAGRTQPTLCPWCIIYYYFLDYFNSTMSSVVRKYNQFGLHSLKRISYKYQQLVRVQGFFS